MVRLAAIALLVVGVLGLVYGGFSYTRQTSKTEIGPIDITVKDREWVNVPIWFGVGAIALGGVLLVWGGGPLRKTM